MSLSKQASDYIKECSQHNVKVDKPTWEEYFISMASLASTRSCDSQTKHGCVITDKKNRVLGIGYNSFPCNMPDDLLPNTRPKKYKWMVHAERNALANCTMRPDNGIAYITGLPCTDCVKSLYQEGIRSIICIDGHGTYLQEEEDGYILEAMQEYGGLQMKLIKNIKT